MAKNPDYPVPALEKGLDILEALAAASVAQSLAELASRLHRSSSELYRMLVCLERRGYVTREALSGKYALSLKLYALAHAHAPTEKLVQAARQPMRELTEKFRESCHLSVLTERGRLIVIAQQDSPDRVRLSFEEGGEFDPIMTASGRLLLAYAPELCREALAGVPLKDRVRFGDAIAKAKRTGVSAAESETVHGVRDLAVLVGARDGRIQAALAVTRLMRRGVRADEVPLLSAMKTTARTIAHSLGLSP